MYFKTKSLNAINFLVKIFVIPFKLIFFGPYEWDTCMQKMNLEVDVTRKLCVNGSG
jgi:hypothetical protein